MGQQTPSSRLTGLFQNVRQKWDKLDDAVTRGDDDAVLDLDQEICPLIAEIVDYQAKTPVEVYEQLSFITSLVRQDCDDRSGVLRDANYLSTLLTRYFGDYVRRGSRSGLASQAPGEVDETIYLNDCLRPMAKAFDQH